MAWFSPQPLIIPDILTANAEYLGNKPAVIIDDQETSWADYGAGTARFGNALLDSGLEKGDRVVILMKNSYEMAEAMFGVIRAGLVAVPLNVSITDAAVAGMIGNSAARAVIASGEHVHRVESLRAELDSDTTSRLISADVELEGWIDYRSMRDAASPVVPDVKIGPRDECNIIYSSGTTGLPKGIVHDHAGREAWGSDMAVALRYHSGARTLCNLGLFSNITWVCVLATFFAGGTIVVSRRFDPEDCLATIEKHRVTHTGMVPLQYQKLYECPERERYDISSLYSSMCCGSPLPLWLKKKLAVEWPGQFIELYGLTEGLVTILSPEDLLRKSASVGLPCPGQKLGILGDDDKLVPVGEAGEIVGECRFLMAGYHENDTASEEATWVHPSGARWLRTGDIGKLDDDGFLYLVDRKKDMILSGGQNIYPADIEAVMVDHDAVSEVAVIGVPSEKWGETPFAVVVLREDTDLGELVGWTNARVGKQQRIAGAVAIDELPRNPNGKVLKRELRDQFADIRQQGETT
ncbi:MAG: AMP-binding protein [Woeseiaceae bacterium]|jgi:acyl-CoA synthetase (AMP-forming)/AMP-acid ligase II